MSEISGVKHVYSMSREGLSMVTVRFEVGEQMEPSLVKLYDKLQSHMDLIPKGVMPPLVKPKSIDDVPVVTITLSSDRLDLAQLRKIGLDVQQRFKSLPETGQSFVVGGSLEQVRVEVEPSRLSANGLTMSQIAGAISAAGQRIPAGDVVQGDRWFNIYTGAFLKNAGEVGNLVVSAANGKPIFLRDVARITQGESEVKTIVDNTLRTADGVFVETPAVTVAVAKKRGSNGIDVAKSVLDELKAMKGTLIPGDVSVIVSRDYGETAQDKVSELIFKLFIVSALVTVLAFVTMGTRPAIIVLITIPAVLLMSLAVAYVLKFTINRVSMFALVFAIGILVDDAIVVVENIYRRWLEAERKERQEIESSWSSDGILHAGEVHARIAELMSDGELAYTASSLPIRDQEESVPALNRDLLYLANRGANGIDGLIASGLGAARATGRPTTIITGDLGFFHDVGSLAAARDIQTGVRIVVLNNGGGGIFERLPQREVMAPEEFEDLMRTPAGLEVERAASLYGLPFRRAVDLDALDAAFGADSDDVSVIEVPVAG